MRRNILAAVLVFAMLIGLRAQGPPPQHRLSSRTFKSAVPGRQPQRRPISIDRLEAITAGNLAMLAYISSDLMEGRETASRASPTRPIRRFLLKMWASSRPATCRSWLINPHGHEAPGGHRRPPRSGLLPGIRHERDPGLPDHGHIEVAKSGAVKSRDFRDGLDFQAQGRRRRRRSPSRGRADRRRRFRRLRISEPSIG